MGTLNDFLRTCMGIGWLESDISRPFYAPLPLFD